MRKNENQKFSFVHFPILHSNFRIPVSPFRIPTSEFQEPETRNTDNVL